MEFPPKDRHIILKVRARDWENKYAEIYQIIYLQNYRELSESNIKKTMNQMKCALKV